MVEGKEVYDKDLIRQSFLLRNELININHGSFGTVPKSVFQAHQQYLLEQESCPEVWFRSAFFKHINNSRDLVANLINANSVDEVVMVENASYAVNAIVRSYPFKKGDAVVVFDSAYRMVTDTLRFMITQLGLEIIEVKIEYPVKNSDELVKSFEKTLVEGGDKVKWCIFSHISSMPTMIEPVQELTKVAKQHGKLVLVDGAHAPGVLDIDVQAIGADCYTGNCHKWLFAPKGCAFLWVSKQAQQLLDSEGCNDHGHFPQPVVISSSRKYDYVGRFEYTGTRDYTPFCALPSALQFIDSELGGMEMMRRYCFNLVRQGADVLVKKWNTSYLVPDEMQGVMINVILPDTAQTEEVSQMLQSQLYEKYHITFVSGYVVTVEKRIYYTRISGQVYLDVKDFEVLADAVLALLSEIVVVTNTA